MSLCIFSLTFICSCFPLSNSSLHFLLSALQVLEKRETEHVSKSTHYPHFVHPIISSINKYLWTGFNCISGISNIVVYNIDQIYCTMYRKLLELTI